MYSNPVPNPTKPRRWSLAARLSAWYAGSAFLLVVAVLFFLYGLLVANLEREDNQLLADEFQTVRTLLTAEPGDISRLKQTLEWETSARQHFRFLVRIMSSDGQMLVESPGMSELLPLEWLRTHQSDAAASEIEGPTGRAFHVMTQSVAAGAPYGAVEVQIAMDRTSEEELLASYRRGLFGALIISLILCTVVGYQIARRGLKPLREMADTASQIRSNTLGERIETSGLPAELLLLGGTFNEMLDRLQESFERLSRFSADIAHELRTPVNNLRGEAEVALGKPRTPEAYREVLGSCLEECDRLSRMIDSLLFLARAEKSKPGLLTEEVDVAKELETVREFYDAAASESGVTLAVNVVGTISARVDRVLFQRAVSNLVSNALAHTPAGGEVVISAAADAELLKVEVTDTGTGIAPEHLPHVFDRFYRADASRSSKSGGVGLGLAIVRTIAQMHGGSAQVTSTLGKGVRATLKFPIAAHG